MNPKWIFSIGINSNSKLSPHSIGLDTTSLDDVRKFAEIIGSEQEVKIPCSIKINEPEDSPKLKALLRAIEETYGFKPSPWRIVPKELRSEYFGVGIARNLSLADLDACEYLRINSIDVQIGEKVRGSDAPDENGSNEIEVKALRNPPTQPIGFFSPSMYAMTEAFKDTLESERLTGFAPVRLKGADLWRLSSSIILPRTSLRLVNADGADTDPDDWSHKWASKWWDDNRGPQELIYSRKEIEPIGPFDLAYTYERTGIRSLAAREVIVSQRFRRILAERGVKKVMYATVKLVD